MVGLQRHNSAYTARVVRTARDCRGRNLPWGSPARFRGRWDCFDPKSDIQTTREACVGQLGLEKKV